MKRPMTALLTCLLACLMLFSACDGAGSETTGNVQGGETLLPTPQETDDPSETTDAIAPEMTTTPEDEITTGSNPPVVTHPGPEPADRINAVDEVELSMEAVWSLKTHTDANGVNCRVIQGGCTDGTYLYVAFNDGGSTNENSISAIRKYHIATRSLVATFENLCISHCNDMTYNPETNEILMVHNSPDRQHVSIFDAASLTFKEKITIDLEIYSMSYDPYEQCYWVGISHGYTFAKLDFDFNQVGDIYEGYASGYTKQGMDIDSKYIYFLQYNQNSIMIYDKSGAFVKELPLPKTNHEPENICHIGDSFYIGYLESGGGTMYHVTIGEKQADPFTVEMEEIAQLPSYTAENGTVMKMPQGICTDGTYLYLAMNDSSTYTSAIRKIDPKTGNVLATYEGIKAGLTNDLAYQPDTKQIIAVFNGNEKSKIAIYDAATLAHVKTVTLEMSIYAMAYDSVQKCYFVGVSGGYNFAKLDLNFKKVGDTITGVNLGNTKQGMNCDGKYFCMIMSASNNLALYNTNGTLIGCVGLPETANSAQSICNIGNTYYIVCEVSDGGAILYRASIDLNIK